MPGIVVGVDGSEHYQQALEWAMKEAALKQAPLTVLAVHQVAGSYWNRSPIIFPADKLDQEKSRQAAEEAVSQAAGRLGVTASSVTVQAASGLPGPVLH